MADAPLLVNMTDVLRLELKEGDTLVMRAPRDMKLSQPQRVNATEALEMLIQQMGLAGKVRALVLDGGWDLKVIAPEGQA